MISRRASVDIAPSTLSRVQHHLHTIWLFTRSDLKTIVLPSTIFAVSHGLGYLQSEHSTIGVQAFLFQTVLTLLWTWLNLLPFCIDNQRRPSSIQEDAVNKPWRPIPSNRILPSRAGTLMVVFYTAAVLFSACFGGLAQSLALIGLGFWYNNLEGANKNFLVRNLINGFGFVCFSSGALDVLLGGVPQLLVTLSPWFLVIGLIVLTTVQTQDMHDQDGDRQQGRKTMPLVLGDSITRVITATLMLCWSLAVPAIWDVSFISSAPFIALGALIGGRLLLLRSVASDKIGAAVWNLWMVGLYLFPLLSGADLRTSLLI